MKKKHENLKLRKEHMKRLTLSPTENKFHNNYFKKNPGGKKSKHNLMYFFHKYI